MISNAPVLTAPRSRGPLFAHHALPPEARNEEPEAPTYELSLPAPAGKMPTATLRERIHAVLHRSKGDPAEGKFRAAEIARAAEVSESSLSFWLNWREGDAPLKFAKVAEFETALTEWMDAAALVAESRAEGHEVFATPVSTAIIEFVKDMRRCGGLGVIYGDAGWGKTQAMKLLQLAMPRALTVTASAWSSSAAGVAALLFARLRLHRSRKASLMAKVAASLKSAPRTVVIDNAHQCPAAYRFLCNLHDLNESVQHRVTMVLIGNPEIVDVLRSNDQHASRITRVLDLSTVFPRGANNELLPAARAKILTVCNRLAAQWCPGQDEGLGRLCARVAEVDEGGHFRAVSRRLQLTADLLKTEAFKDDPRRAFAAAHASLAGREMVRLED